MTQTAVYLLTSETTHDGLFNVTVTNLPNRWRKSISSVIASNLHVFNTFKKHFRIEYSIFLVILTNLRV